MYKNTFKIHIRIKLKNILFKWLLVKKLIYVYCYMKLKDIKLMYRIEGPSLKNDDTTIKF